MLYLSGFELYSGWVPLICTMIIIQEKYMYFLVSDRLWLFPSFDYSPSSHKGERSLLKERTMHESLQQKQQCQGIFKPEIGDHIMDHISFTWPNFFFICNILLYY